MGRGSDNRNLLDRDGKKGCKFCHATAACSCLLLLSNSRKNFFATMCHFYCPYLYTVCHMWKAHKGMRARWRHGEAANEYPLGLARDVRTTHQGIPNSIMEIPSRSLDLELCGTDNDPSMMGIDFEMRRLRPRSFERKK